MPDKRNGDIRTAATAPSPTTVHHHYQHPAAHWEKAPMWQIGVGLIPRKGGASQKAKFMFCPAAAAKHRDARLKLLISYT